MSNKSDEHVGDPENEILDLASEYFKDGMMQMRMIFEQLYQDCLESGANARNGICMSFQDGSMIAFSKTEKLTEEIRKTYDRVLASTMADEVVGPDYRFIFMISENDKQVWATPREYWEKEGCMMDQHISSGVDWNGPEGWLEVGESLFEYEGDEKFEYWTGYARKSFTMSGFKEVIWDDGEVARLKILRDEMVADGDEEDQYEIDDINKRIDDIEHGNGRQ